MSQGWRSSREAQPGEACWVSAEEMSRPRPQAGDRGAAPASGPPPSPRRAQLPQLESEARPPATSSDFCPHAAPCSGLSSLGALVFHGHL